MKRLFGFLIVLFTGFSALGQNVFLRTTGEAATVCGDSVLFTIEVRNLSNQNYAGVVVKSKLPPGILFAKDKSEPFSHVSSSLDYPSFNIGTLSSGELRTIRFEGITSCALVTYLNDNNILDGLVHNETIVTYTAGGQEFTFEEPSGSESYNVYYPVLTLRVNTQDKNQEATGEEQVERQFTITNTGNGPVHVSDVFLELTYGGGISFISVTGANTSVGSTNATRTVLNFLDFGTSGEYLDPNESVTLIERVKVIACNSVTNLSTNYFIKWGCNNAVCNAISNNSQDASLIQFKAPGTARISMVISPTTDLTFCQEQVEFRGEIKNYVEASSDELTNRANRGRVTRFYVVEGSNGFTSLSEFKVLNKAGNFEAIVPSSVNTYNNSSGQPYILYSFDITSLQNVVGGVSGLSDADEDGEASDLLPQDKIILSMRAALACPMEFTNPRSSGRYEILSSGVNYQTLCGQAYFGGGGSVYFDNIFEDATLSGPADLLEGQSAKYTFNIKRRFYGNLVCPNGNFSSVVTLPSRAYKVTGVTWISTSGYPSKPVSDFYQDPDGTLHVTGGGWYGRYEVNVTLDCALGAPATPNSLLEWRMYHDCMGTCCRQFIAEDSYEIFNHCTVAGGDACFRTSTFEVERTSFGYTEPANGYYFSLPSKLTRSASMRLDAGMETDVIQTVAKGSVIAGNFTNAHVEIHYRSPVDENILEFVGGHFIVNTGSGAVTYPITAPPVFSQSEDIYSFDFAVENLSSFPNGTTVDLYANFKIKKSDKIGLGETMIERFRAFHYGNMGLSKVGCESLGDIFYILKNYNRAVSHSYYTGYSCNTDIVPRVLLLPYGLPNTGVDPFPGEFRPNTRVTEVRATIPAGTTYRSGSAIFNINGKSVLIGDPQITTNTDGTAQLVWTSNQLPILDAQNTYAKIFQFVLDNDCLNELATYLPIPVIISYTNYEFDEGNAVGLTYAQNHNFTKRFAPLRLQANLLQDAFSETVSWPVTLCEDYSSGGGADYTWLTFEPPSNINLVSATINGTSLPIEAYDAAAPHKRWIKLGRIGAGKCAEMVLTATYTNCKENVVDQINLRAGHTCRQYPNSPDETSCNSTGVLVAGNVKIRYKNADLTQTVTKLNPVSDLCEAIPYQVDLLSSGIGSMRDVFLLLDIPPGLIYRPGSASFLVPTSGSSTWATLPDAYSINTGDVTGFGWNLSEEILNSAPFVNLSRMQVRFDLEASCSDSIPLNYDPGIPVVITSRGRTNCDDWVVRPFQSKVEIDGFVVTGNDLIPNVEVTDICVNGFVPQVNISITNPGLNPSIAQDLVVMLPRDLDYSGVIAGSRQPFSVVKNLLFTEITWKLPAGIPAGATVRGFNFLMSLTNPLLNAVAVETRTFIYGSGTCVTTGELCSLRATTGRSIINVGVQQDNCYRCQTPTPVISGDCADDQVTFTAWNGANIAVSCSGGEVAISNNGNGNVADSLSYTAFYENAGVVEQVIKTKFKLNTSGSLNVPVLSGVFQLSRLEVEQSPFNPGNSGVIVLINNQVSGDVCGRMQIFNLSPAPLTWNFGDGESQTGSNVTHTYESSGSYTITVNYCSNRTITRTFTARNCDIQDLWLYSQCYYPERDMWYIYNPNPIPISVQLQINTSMVRRSLIVKPQEYMNITTPSRGRNTQLTIYWTNENDETRSETVTSSDYPCEEPYCYDCYASFTLEEGKDYVLSAWVKEESLPGTLSYDNLSVDLEFKDGNEELYSMSFAPAGAIIDGWQRVWSTFTVPYDVVSVTVRLRNRGTNEAYFDDIRIHPFNSSMKSFVYDPLNLRLMAELDENNYATFYEYDEEGALIRVKKETERGVKTIQESRNNTVKIAVE